MQMNRCVLPLLLALGVMVSGCSSTMTKPGNSLYERLGGKDAIVAVVDDFIGNVAADKRINGYFAKANVPRLKQLLVEQICAGTGGPCKYTGRDMKTTHAGMGVNDAAFNALVEDLVKTLDKFKVPTKEKNELLGVLGPMKSDIVDSGSRY